MNGKAAMAEFEIKNGILKKLPIVFAERSSVRMSEDLKW